jgi:hypothetical protein
LHPPLFCVYICSWDFWTAPHMFHIATTKRFLHVFKCSSSLHPTKPSSSVGQTHNTKPYQTYV